jgi:hypothetical protein
VDIEYDEKGKPITRDAATYVEQNVQIEITRDGDEEKKNAIKAELSEAQRYVAPFLPLVCLWRFFAHAHLCNRIRRAESRTSCQCGIPTLPFPDNRLPSVSLTRKRKPRRLKRQGWPRSGRETSRSMWMMPVGHGAVIPIECT